MKKTIILAYHDLDSKDHPTEKTDPPTIETVIRVNEFEDHMSFLAKAGYSVLSIRDYLNKQKTPNDSSNGKDIVLTFDDGHISNHRYALPILKKHSFSATFFIIADYIGKPFFMGSYEIKELLNNNMEIGSHSKSHRYLTELTHEEVEKELEESKTLLEQEYAIKIDVFAYPGGHQNSRIVNSVAKAGYTAAASCITGRNNPTTNPYLLRRIELRRGTSVQEFQNAITPMNIIFFQCIDTAKLIMKKTLGLSTYEHLRQKLYHLYPFKR